MFKSLKNTIKHSFIYGLGNISSKLIGFILLPLYTGALIPSEYGILAILEITGQIIVSVFSFNISTAMMRWSAETKDENDKKSIIFTSLFFTVIISLLLLISLIPIRETFSEYFFNTKKFNNYFLLLFLTSSLGIYNLIPLTIMRLRERSSLFAILNTVKFTLTLIANIYFLGYRNMGIEGILLSQLIGQLFLTIFSIPITLQNIIFKFRFSILREMISYGVPLIFSTIFTLAFTMGDRFIIKHFAGETSVGTYSLGHKIASVINVLILQSFQLGFLPIAYKKLGDVDEKRFFSKTLTYYTLILVFSALSISLFGKELIELLSQNKEYWISYTVIPIVAFAFVIKGIQYNFSLSFHYSKKTIYNAIVVFVMAIINLALNVFLVQKMGYMGAAYSMLISMIIMMFFSYYFGQKVYYIPFEIKKITLLVFIGVGLFSLSIFFNQFNIFIRIIIKMGLLSLFALIIYYAKIFSETEIMSLKKGFNDLLNLISNKKKIG